MTAVDIPAASGSAEPRAVRTSFGGAASRRLVGIVDGPVRAAIVRAVFPAAVYLDTGRAVVAVVARDGLWLPNSVVVAATRSRRPFAHLTRGEPATVGGGQVCSGDLEVTVSRWWTPPQPPGLVRPEHLPARTDRLARLLQARRRTLAEPVARRLGQLAAALRARPAVDAEPAALVGLGQGLTPAGDDVLAGVLLALRHLGRPACADRLWAAIAEQVPLRTSALSATLLAAAAEGDTAPPVVDLLTALAGHRPLESALDRLLAVGATSGSDITHGLLAGTTGP